jgi:chromosome segregation ATPase
LSAQQFQEINAVLLVQFGPGDLVLNAPLLDAMASERACRNELNRVLNGPLQEIGAIRTTMPAPHAAGTFQIHIAAQLAVRNQLSADQQDAAVDAIVAHLKRRLDQVLYEQPMQSLTKRRDELDRRHTELQAQRAALLARAEAVTTTVTTLQQHKTALEQQLLSARIDVATETRGKEIVEKMIAESTARRDDLREKVAHRNAELAGRSAELTALMGRLNGTATEGMSVQEGKAAIATIQAEIQGLRSKLDLLDELAKDEQRMLAVWLEQLPSSALATQRANARLQSLVEEQKSLEERQSGASAARTEATQYEANAERVLIDITVTRTMLTEIQGRLARLQPVQYELLRPR